MPCVTRRRFHGFQVDAFEEHHKLRTLEFDARRARDDGRQLKSPTLEPLAIEDESAAVPEENFGPVPSLRQKNEEMARVRIRASARHHEAEQAVEALAHVRWVER